MIRFTSIEIDNYRQYRNLQVDFTRQDNHDLFMLIADNGIGKTNFLNAITWCLYEKESHLQNKYGALPIINVSSIDDAAIGDHLKVSVRIKLQKDDAIVQIYREEEYIKQEDLQNPIHRVSKKFAYLEMDDDRTIRSISAEDAKEYVNQIFPEDINQYFFFDNEQMNNYFTKNSNSNILTAIKMITKVNILDSVSSRLQDVNKIYKSAISAGNTDLQKLETIALKAKAELEETDRNLRDCQNEIASLDDQIKALDERLRGYENLRQWIDDSRMYAQEKQTKQEDAEKLNKKINEFVSEYYPLLKLYPTFKKTYDKIMEIDRNKQLPPPIRKEIYETSLHENKCQLCGSELSEFQIKNIENIISKFQISTPATSCLVEHKNKIRELMNKVMEYPILKQQLMDKRTAIESEIENLNQKIVSINTKLRDIDNIEGTTKLLDKRDVLQSNYNDQLKLQSGYMITLSDQQKAAKEANDAWENARAKANINKKANLRYETTVKLQNIVDTVYNDLIDETREEISKETTKNYKNLLWKKDTYDKVIVDKNYNVALLDKKGRNARGSTSAAELSLLALAFTTAIHSVSKFDCPIIIDTPLGRVSSENRSNFSKALLELSNNKQIILLFTPDEYSNQVAEIFDGNGIKKKGTMTDDEKCTIFEEAENV